jgi:hypothetical protein
MPPQIFYGRAKIHASFGQNIKITGKLREIRGIIFGISRKKLCDPIPPLHPPWSPTILGRNIRSGKLILSPPPLQTRSGPYAHGNNFNIGNLLKYDFGGNMTPYKFDLKRVYHYLYIFSHQRK